MQLDELEFSPMKELSVLDSSFILERKVNMPILLFIFIDTIVHILVVKWEIKTNKDLFCDIECGIKRKRDRK